MSIRIRHLRLLGAEKNYEVDFTRGEEVRPLCVIAGEISTGKTSVLEFIAYGLGASDHPRHQEVQRQVRSVLLEVELSGETVVIERAAFTDQNVAYVHRSALDALETPHVKSRHPIDPPGSDDSLSMLLLEHCGLAGIALKEKPTRTESPLQPLSIRDVLWLCFLENARLDSRGLLFEQTYMKNYKLVQLIEIVFGVHDEQLTRLGEQVQRLDEQRQKRLGALESLRAFLEENDITDRMRIVTGREEREGQLTQAQETIAVIEAQMAATTEFATGLRAEYARARQAAGEAANAVRYDETLLRRLLPLRAQYAEDERKLHFVSEAKTLFDPLRIEICPACLQTLPDATSIREGRCTLCHQAVPEGDSPIELKSELAAVRSRRRELDKYIAEVEDHLVDVQRLYGSARRDEQRAQASLDEELAGALSPYVGQRDHLAGERQRLRSEISDLDRQLGFLDNLDQRQIEIGRLEEQIARLRADIAERRKTQISRDELLETLSGRFSAILRSFGFPKLGDPEPPYLDKNFVPHVRGVAYRDIGSSGAMTLISLAWQLALFELATEEGHLHPGFLMIDSPQKNLTPEGDPADEFSDPEIGSHVWDHLLAFSERMGDRAQLIIVDNRPRPQADDAVVVRYTQLRDEPPYGLIDNETG